MKNNQVLEKSVLIADSDVVILESIAGRFRHIGFKVITASSGDDALTLYNKFCPDIVIIDEDLKNMDGLQLFLKLFFYNPSIKVILTTRNIELTKNYNNDSENFIVLQKRFSDEDLKKILKDINFVSKTFVESLQ